MAVSKEITLFDHLEEYRKKFYLNQVIRGGLILALLFTSILFVLILSEGTLGFSSGIRTSVFWSLLVGFLGVLGVMVVHPLFQMFKIAQGIGEFDIAGMIRKHFPEIDDKLINLLQLKSTGHAENSLVVAAIQKKIEDLSPVPFAKAINLNVNYRYLKFLALPLGLFLLFALIAPTIMKQGSMHLLNYRKDFPKPKPYDIRIGNHPNQIIAGESFKLDSKVEGKVLPAELYLYLKKSGDASFVNYPMTKTAADAFEFEFSNLKEDFSYYIGNEEVSTDVHKTEVLKRPSIRNFRVIVGYPTYTGLRADTLPENIGDFKALKGSIVSWILEPGTDVVQALFIGGDTVEFEKLNDKGRFGRTKTLTADESYFISLASSRNVRNSDTVKYHIEIMPDRYPTILLNNAMEQFEADIDLALPLDFDIADDFGFSKLAINYRFVKSGKADKVSKDFSIVPLSVMPRNLLQSKTLELDLENLGMVEGDKVEYFIQVWDNDYITGPKSSVSGTYSVNFKSVDEKYTEVDESQEEIKKDMDELNDQLKDIGDRYEKMKEKMLNQKSLSYDDKKELRSLIQKQSEVSEQMQQMQKEFEKNKEMLQNNQMISQETLEKYEKLNELLKKADNPLLEKLMKNLQENMEKLTPEEIRKQMEQMQLKEEDLQKSIERTMELLKQLEVQQKVEELSQKLENLKEKQEMLNEKTEKANNPEQVKDLEQKQAELNKEFEKIQEQIKELNELKEKTESPDKEEMEQLEKDADGAKKDMEDADSDMKEGGKSKSSKSQKSAAQKMEKMKSSLDKMKFDSDQEQAGENLESLREILENLLTLSFDQEDLRDEVRDLKFGDPQVNEKSRSQKKLMDEMAMVRDSLFELAKRAFEIEKFVTEESTKIVEGMKQAESSLSQKNTSEAARQEHIAMTSINNLANMLSDAMQQMQQNMKNAKPGSGACKKPGGKSSGMKGLGEQQKELNGKMKSSFEEMMGMGKGKGMDPKKLGEMAAQQEMLRQQLKEAHGKIQKEGGKALGNMGEVMKEMEDTEQELKNNQLTAETLLRQQRILNRLLDATKAVREKEEFDEKRESNTGRELKKKSPDELDKEELKNLIRQEMLKTNQMEYSSDFIQLIERYFQLLELKGK